MQEFRYDRSKQWRVTLVYAAASFLLFGEHAPSAHAQEIIKEIIAQDVTIEGHDGPIAVKRFAADGTGKRAAVIILHGSRGIAHFAAAYTRYADGIAMRGIDAYLVSYYSAGDAAAMTSDLTTRTAYFRAHLQNWASRVRDVIGAILTRSDASGKIGLLGFSNGGFLTVTSAATDPRISAIVVFYGGIADGQSDIAHLPPLLALHGDADRNVPLSSGTALVEKARALGGPADLVVYPGAGHAFDFDPARGDARDASDRALSFLERQLK